ncbi:type VII secretion protein EssB [Gracilibacillus halotolerans]|uniref:Type VII secretion protein EssB n=1 Tax=Gracilibacillus halotolerans TaxID=74386 RepID=A0A841RNH0_9BACI|nr:type VII secretion protein EssB [Gracilibacillus halotolerans]MBB6512976.1 type VII secretion protein EssB [Gracilibacillus halotolerans]
MEEKKIELQNLSLTFTIEGDTRVVRLPKSQTQIKDSQQTRMLTAVSGESFVPLTVKEEGDAFEFSFEVDRGLTTWKQLSELHRHEQLRLLYNISRLVKLLQSRITFFLHPDNVVFDDNLQPLIIYRGIRNVIPPFEMEDEEFLKQLKCYSIALLSKKFTFDQLYNGSIHHAKETEFERQVRSKESINELIDYLEKSYQAEQKKTKKTMQLLPTKRFTLYKRLAISFMIASVLLAAPLIYLGIVSLPYQQSLLKAHEEYLISNYDGVITTLNGENAEKMPKSSKYILAHSYLLAEPLAESDKDVILNNLNLNSDSNYLLYWIYNGRGEFEEAMEKAKYLDDPQLIMYGLIKQIEAAKNNPKLSGSERDDMVNNLQQELNKYREDYQLDGEEPEDMNFEDSEQNTDSQIGGSIEEQTGSSNIEQNTTEESNNEEE